MQKAYKTPRSRERLCSHTAMPGRGSSFSQVPHAFGETCITASSPGLIHESWLFPLDLQCFDRFRLPNRACEPTGLFADELDCVQTVDNL